MNVVSGQTLKAILCILAYQQPKSFNNNGIVNIENNWLKRANSKNYHHYFPKAFLKKQGYQEDEGNNIVNITIVDDHLNKREIGAKAPSKYMATFQESNTDLVKTMRTHLIGDLTKYGIWDDDFEKFMTERSKAISKEIKKRIITRREDEYY